MIRAEGDEEEGDVGGANAADALGVGKSGRAGGGELLAALRAQAVDGIVIEVVREANIFQMAEFFDLAQVAIKVAAVADAVNDLVANRWRQSQKGRREFNRQGRRGCGFSG
jgi:uncharacterized protein YgbK (DUF1537 family)